MAEEAKSEEAAAPAEGDEAVQKKDGGAAKGASPASNQKLIFIVLILNAVLMLGIAVIVVGFVTKKSKTVSLDQIAAEKDKPKEEPKAEGKGEGGKGEKKGEAANDNFLKESFTVNLNDQRGTHYAKVDVEIEVEDDFTKREVERQRPKIRDFILVVLSSKTYEQIESVDGRDFLREEIRNKINGYLTRGQIKNVYFTQFIVQ